MTYTFRKFELVPAAITGRPANTFIAVKHIDNTKSKRLWQRTRFNGVTTHYAPDRTIYTVSSKASHSGISNISYDELLIISPTTNPRILNNAGFNYAMASPLHTSPESETRRNPHVKLYCDSGGFQLFSGAID